MESTKRFGNMDDETRRQFLFQGLFALVSVPLNLRISLAADSLESSQYSPFRKSKNMSFSMQEISDRLEIQDVLTRYCYAVDDRDWDAYRHLFTSDAVIDDTITGGIKSGVEEHISYMKRALSKVVISQHAISTVLIELDGNVASVRAHCSCPIVLDTGGAEKHVMFQGLWYRETLVRREAGWKIRSLFEEGYWKHNAPAGFKF
jgi:ketosteroid isomerase-like protein